MNILIDILHPAHVHFFKYFIWEMKRKGHNVLITTRNKDITINLLDEYKFEYVQISTVRKGLIGMIRELFLRNIAFYRVAKRFKPDVLMGEMGSTIAMMGVLLRVPSLVFWDTEVSTLSNVISYPLATAVYTPTSYHGRVRGNHVTYEGLQKLAYLHPKWFVPNEGVLAKYGLKKNTYSIVRLVSLTSNHDKNTSGISNPRDLVSLLKKYGPVFITSEDVLPPDLEPYKLRIAYQDIFDVLSFAKLYVGESATMATESCLLGTPSIYTSSSERGYITDLEKNWHLVSWCKQDVETLDCAKELMANPSAKKECLVARDLLLTKMIDVTAFMISIVEKKKYLQNNFRTNAEA